MNFTSGKMTNKEREQMKKRADELLRKSGLSGSLGAPTDNLSIRQRMERTFSMLPKKKETIH